MARDPRDWEAAKVRALDRFWKLVSELEAEFDGDDPQLMWNLVSLSPIATVYWFHVACSAEPARPMPAAERRRIKTEAVEALRANTIAGLQRALDTITAYQATDTDRVQ